MLQIVANLLHASASEQNLLQTVHKLVHSVALSWNCFTSPWRLDVGTAVVSTIYDFLRQISTHSTTFDCFRHLAACITLKNAVQRPKTSVVEHKGWYASLGFLAVFELLQLWFRRDAFRPGCIALGMRPDFAIIGVPNRLGRCLRSERAFLMAQRAIRFSEAMDNEIREATRKRSFTSPTAFIRHAVKQELSGRSEELVGAEERLAASMEQIRWEVFRLGRAQQALFAFADSLAKVLLTCVPEPGGEAMEAAIARAQGRHARLLKSAGQAMVGDSQLAMQDLVTRGEG
jgi:hypothetical protein